MAAAVTRRKRNQSRGQDPLASSLSESTEALRPRSKRQPASGTWKTPKNADGEAPPNVFRDDVNGAVAMDAAIGLPPPAAPGSEAGMVPGAVFPPPQPVAVTPQMPPPSAVVAPPMAAAGVPAVHAVPGQAPAVQQAWGEEEDAVLREAVLRFGVSNWPAVSSHMLPSCHRSADQCEIRWRVVKNNPVKGPWLPEEDQLLRDLVGQFGPKQWSKIAEKIPGRAGKQCRERWLNHLDSSVKKSDWTPEEDKILLEAQRRVGNRWSEIARMLPGRAENAVKNRYNSLITKKLTMLATQEEQRGAAEERSLRRLEETMVGKNVLQQLFSVVGPGATSTHAVQLPARGQGSAVGPLGLSLQPTDGSRSPARRNKRGDLHLNLALVQPTPQGAAVEVDSHAEDHNIPTAQLLQAKQYLDHERARAMMFSELALSSKDMQRISEVAKQAPENFFRDQGIEIDPPQVHNPAEHITLRPLQCDSPARGGNRTKPDAPSPMASPNSRLTRRAGDGLFDEELPDLDSFDVLGSHALRSLSIDDEDWPSLGKIAAPVARSSDSMEMRRSRTSGAPKLGSPGFRRPTAVDTEASAAGSRPTSANGSARGAPPRQKGGHTPSRLRSRGGGGGAERMDGRRSGRGATGGGFGRDGGTGAPNQSLDLNDFSFNSKMGSLSLEDEDWKSLFPSGDAGDFRLSPKDAWVRTTHDSAAAEAAAKLALSGTLGTTPSGSDARDRWASAMSTELSSTQHSGGLMASYNSHSFDEEEWDMLATAAAASPTKRTPLHSFRLQGLTPRLSPAAIKGVGGPFKSFPDSNRRPQGAGAQNGGTGPVAAASYFTFDDAAIERAPLPANGSVQVPAMTPRAMALMEINADFKAGKISKEEKQRRKQSIMSGAF
uniref:Uncharacterized protein n=2 Tax=Rhizochromulina marina TaxID=1034831 RepID=A0A7S2WV82_9STRA|mmetsp:Transcript_5375/g.15800  ORF Transcript_5375/g.15800 Transcript_5375/m.15800 type:complete len:886 (+) Transcript_5375:198-2855(+)